MKQLSNRRPAVLYISYDGMLEPLGQSQVLAYQERLATEYEVHIISFEKTDDWHHAELRRAVQQRFGDAGMHWHPRRYHKRPSALATMFDVLNGYVLGLWLIIRYRIGLIHARSYVASVMALALKRTTDARFIFDMRGFWADERVDGGLWRCDGSMFRTAKWFERRFLLGADHVVSLTSAAVREMRTFSYLKSCMPPISVIPTCANLDLFKPSSAANAKDFVLGYVGSAGTWYLFDEVLICFAELRRLLPNSRLLIVNRTEHSYIRERLHVRGVPDSCVELISVKHEDVPLQMARMHAGIFFIKPAYSKQASAPTKLGEFLGCGIPCLGNAGVGDMAEVLETERVGVVLPDFKSSSLVTCLHRLLDLAADPNISERCVAAARYHFSLTEGVARYRDIYHRLLTP